MAGDFNKPILTDAYTAVLQSVRELAKDLALMLDSTATQNMPVNAIRWNSTNARFEKYNGTSWAALASSYAISISGDAATVGGKSISTAATANTVVLRDASGIINATKITASASGDWYLQGGNDAQFWDVNVANAVGIKGIQSSAAGYLTFGGTNLTTLGHSGDGILKWGTNTVYHTGNFSPNATAQNNIGGAGSYGALTLLNNVGGWAGFRFGSGLGSNNRYLLTSSGQTGEFDAVAGWQWRFDNGALAYGTVPWARLSGVPAFNYLPLSGGILTGTVIGKANVGGGLLNSNETGNFAVRGSAGNAAALSFQIPGQYGVNIGIDTDNFFKIGGWSLGANWAGISSSAHIYTTSYGWLHDRFGMNPATGSWIGLSGQSQNITLPAGGTWAWFFGCLNGTASGVNAGGYTLPSTGGGNGWGFAWKVSN